MTMPAAYISDMSAQIRRIACECNTQVPASVMSCSIDHLMLPINEVGTLLELLRNASYCVCAFACAYIYLWDYVCMYARMYPCMYVCMCTYVCMYICMHVCVGVKINCLAQPRLYRQSANGHSGRIPGLPPWCLRLKPESREDRGQHWQRHCIAGQVLQLGGAVLSQRWAKCLRL